MTEKKILYIPSINIDLKAARCYYIAKGLSEYYKLYWITWHDPRNIIWKGKKHNAVNTVLSFFSSLFRLFSISLKADDPFFYIRCPVFLSSGTRKIIGEVAARKIMRWFNGKVLRYLVKKIKPDILFHADGFFFFPALEKANGIKYFSDVQDDLDLSGLKPALQRYEMKYCNNCFNRTNENFIVSEKANENLSTLFQAKFETAENGADFDSIRSVTKEEQNSFRQRFGIPDKIIVSYIGGSAWFDKKFTEKLVRQAFHDLPEVVFIFAGNLPVISSPNLINVGVISPHESYILYTMSKAGVLLKHTANDPFLKNSVPLKLIQYSAARKPVVSFPVNWIIQNKFENILIIETEEISEWISAIRHSLAFEWKPEFDKSWDQYNWGTIIPKFLNEMEKVQK